jgi:hypothetical protein
MQVILFPWLWNIYRQWSPAYLLRLDNTPDNSEFMVDLSRDWICKSVFGGLCLGKQGMYAENYREVREFGIGSTLYKLQRSPSSPQSPPGFHLYLYRL